MIDSPVNTLLKQLIHCDTSLPQPLYIQVSQQIINAIQRRYLSKGTKLPGTRVLATLLNIHRNTAVAIYEELCAQGWVDIKPNKGTFVIEPEQKTLKITAPTQKINQAYAYAKTAGFPFQNSFHLKSTASLTKAKYVINDGKPDLRLHPVSEFTRWYSAAMKRKTLAKKWNTTEESSVSMFQTELCNFLNTTRGFHINPQNLINTRSTELSLYIVSQLLIQKNNIVLVGHLSNYASNMIFQQAGADIKTIPVDDEGLNVDYIRQHFVKNRIRCVYVCSHRDYPTGVKLSANRRLQLLQLAKEYKFAIIEDDYDFDFQYEGSSMLPMASSDANGVVIYLGKFGQSLFPSFQTGFIIAPENIILEAKNYLQLLDTQGDLIQEQMLAELIHEGELYRLLKKNIVVYRKRRDLLCEQLKTEFGEKIQWRKPVGGLAIWIQFNAVISLVKLAEEAEKNSLFLPKTILYQDKNTCAIRFGFGHLNEEEITSVLKILKKAYDTILQEKNLTITNSTQN